MYLPYFSYFSNYKQTITGCLANNLSKSDAVNYKKWYNTAIHRTGWLLRIVFFFGKESAEF